jgi:hypothetical protein
MESILLSKYSVSSFSQAFLAPLITAYLLASSKKSCSAWRLIMFFAAFSLSLVSSFLLMAVHAPWRMWFGPLQGIVGLLGLIAMIQFAYTFPGDESSSRSRRALLVSVVGGLIAMFAMAYHGDRRDIAMVVLGVAFAAFCLWPALVFATRARAFTRDALGTPISILGALRTPEGREARAHRAFALVMCVLLSLSLLALAESLGLVSLQRLVSSLATFHILFLISFVFVYVNNAPMPSSFMAKLVGIPIVTLMIVMGIMGSFILDKLEDRFDEDRRGELKFAMKSVVQEDHAFLPKHVEHIFVYPLESEGGAEL